ncbi:MAG TPA: hypothetical protein VHM94_10120 [Acidimicrobiia bacterium]|nr:hypothetical protein [Acidimicrobiia bacterium]
MIDLGDDHLVSGDVDRVAAEGLGHRLPAHHEIPRIGDDLDGFLFVRCQLGCCDGRLGRNVVGECGGGHPRRPVESGSADEVVAFRERTEKILDGPFVVGWLRDSKNRSATPRFPNGPWGWTARTSSPFGFQMHSSVHASPP